MYVHLHYSNEYSSRIYMYIHLDMHVLQYDAALYSSPTNSAKDNNAKKIHKVWAATMAVRADIPDLRAAGCSV